MPKFISEIRKVIGGMVRDIVKRDIPKNKYFNAENINLTPNGSQTLGGASVSLGSTFAVDLGYLEPADNDYEAWLVYLNLKDGVFYVNVHDFTYNNGITYTASISSVAATPTLRYNDLVSQLESAIAGWGLIGSVYIGATPIDGVVSIGLKIEGYTANLGEVINGVSQDIVVIKEYYGNDEGGFIPLKSINIDSDLFIISTNGLVTRLGVAQKDYSAESWTYTVLLQTNQIVIPTTQVIDLDGQVDFGERVSLYFTTNGIPRCFYVKKQSVWVANSAMIYYDTITPNPIGYYTYSGINSETGLQVLENFARVGLISVNDSGGSLTTGNKQYFVRQLVGEETESGVGIGSNLVSIYTFAQTDFTLYGQLGGQQTNKSVSLEISGLNNSVYDKFQLIEVSNIDGVLSAFIVNTYDITAETMDILHTGNENYISFDLAELATQQILIKNAQNLVIARNRLFISNIETQADYNLSEWAQTISIASDKIGLNAIGATYTNIGEYQLPANIFNSSGYMVNETYRFGIILYFKNGFVSSPYFIRDYKIIGSNLTDGGTTTPTEVYAYYPEFTVDLTSGLPTVDGVPLQDAIYGYSIVRQECIPEVLATGYIMPAATNAPITDYYTTGSSIITASTYAETSTSAKRKQMSFVSPDILFGQSNIQPLSGDKILNYGQTEIYSVSSEFTAGDTRFLRELSCNNVTATAVELEVNVGEIVPFNSDGVVDILGRKLKNEVVYTFAGTIVSVFGNNQLSLALELDDFANPINSATDYGFYYAQYFRPLTNKYGDIGNGNYISCGHFREIGAESVYIDTVFGGDTFTQKNFIKHCNFYAVSPSTASARIRALSSSGYLITLKTEEIIN
jgi:hypothetical protein